ncbi:MAG: hypothetical protein Fur0041_18860 [Bacteroidia bacterium]
MIRNILTNFSARIAVAAMNFFMLLLTTHELRSGIRGEISIIQLSINLIHLISDIAGGPAIVYLVPRSKLFPLYVTGTLWAAFSSFGVGFLLIHYGLLPSTYSWPVLIVGFLFSLHSINQNILLGQERIKAYNVLLLCQGLLQFIGMAGSIFIFEVHSAESYLQACYVAYGFCFITGLIIVSRRKHLPHLSDSRPLFAIIFANGFFTQAASLTHQLSIRENYFQLNKMKHLGNEAVGIYSTALSLGEAILLFSASVAAVLMSRISNSEDLQQTRLKTISMSKFSLFVTVPAIAFFILLPPEFYSWLLGKDFRPVRDVFITIAPGIALVSFGTVYSHYFSGSGKHYMNFFSGIVGLSVAMISAKMLIESSGTNGAGWSASLAYGSMSLFIFILFLFSRKGGNGEWKHLLPRKEDFQFLKALRTNQDQ